MSSNSPTNARSGSHIRRLSAFHSRHRPGLDPGIAEIHAGYGVAGPAFKVVLLAVFGLDELVSGGAEQCVSASAAGQP
jgi:hypothetical protein